jgi:hypothetical protein
MAGLSRSGKSPPAGRCRIPGADRGRARSLCEALDPKRSVVCFDERPIQFIGEVREPITAPAWPTCPLRCEYKRNGIANLFVFRNSAMRPGPASMDVHKGRAYPEPLPNSGRIQRVKTTVRSGTSACVLQRTHVDQISVLAASSPCFSLPRPICWSVRPQGTVGLLERGDLRTR